MRKMLALPVPPLALGVSWTGRSLLNWVLENSDAGMKGALFGLRDQMGGDAFKAAWEGKAKELNARVEARIVDVRGLPVKTDIGKVAVN